MDLSDLDIPFDAENKAQSQDKNNSANALVVMSADPVEMLTARLSNVLTENHDLKARVKALEDRMQSVLYMLNTEKEGDRGTIRAPSFGNPPSVSERLVTNIDEDASETVQTPSKICFPTEESFSRNLVNMPMYTNAKSVWGAALSSMLIAMVRYYCIRTGTDNISLDEGKIMKTCIYLAPILYGMPHKSLPAVKSPTTKYMSSSISKVGSNGVPQSTAESWYQMTATQDGRDCLKVIKTMIKNAKKMPEVLSLPLSSIVPYVLFPVVKKREDGSACFCISKEIKLRNSPDQWERWCSLLKSSALIKYAMWRAHGKSAATSAAEMMSYMKKTELFNKENLDKLMLT
ncbi:hypothetical protein E4U44_000361 [Claviceps purpurea]|nr:hypothetical protein E4U44_000361 [Claviceps purpurea]